MFYILKIKGTKVIPDFIQIRDDNMTLRAYFRVSQAKRGLEKNNLQKYSNQMIEIIEDISGIKKLERVYQLDKPKGVRGRSSNNDLVKKVLNWSFKIKLKEGLKKTYDWISAETNKKGSNLSRFTKS